MNKNELINSIFYPRKSFIDADENDMLITVDDGVDVGARLFLSNELFPTILYFHGNAELVSEYDMIANIYLKKNIS